MSFLFWQSCFYFIRTLSCSLVNILHSSFFLFYEYYNLISLRKTTSKLKCFLNISKMFLFQMFHFKNDPVSSRIIHNASSSWYLFFVLLIFFLLVHDTFHMIQTSYSCWDIPLTAESLCAGCFSSPQSSNLEWLHLGLETMGVWRKLSNSAKVRGTGRVQK